EIEGRMSVRALMQWSGDRNGGFSEAPAEALWRPLIRSPKWGHKAINVRDQRSKDGSLLSWMKRLIQQRREMPEVTFGDWSFMPVPAPAVLALRYEWGQRKAIIIHNLSADKKKISLDLKASR